MNILDQPPAESARERYAVQTLRKALNVLEAVAAADRPLTVAQIAETVRINRTTTHRLVQTLAETGYLARDAGGRAYGVGLKVLPAAGKLLDTNRLRRETLPYLQELAQKTGERVNLGVLFEGRVLYLAGIEKPSLPMIYSRFGKTAPAHCCSLGKAILAWLPEEEVDALVEAAPLLPMTPNTITGRDAFRDELRRTRAQGYAVDREEHYLGTFCVAVPIHDPDRRPAGAIGLSAGDLDKLLNEVPTLSHTAEVITHILSRR